jgi:hypothetical protein
MKALEVCLLNVLPDKRPKRLLCSLKDVNVYYKYAMHTSPPASTSSTDAAGTTGAAETTAPEEDVPLPFAEDEMMVEVQSPKRKCAIDDDPKGKKV